VAASRHGNTPNEDETVTSGSGIPYTTSVDANRDRRTRWGGLISIVAVPVAIYGVPIYLGLVYRLLTYSEEMLKILTICGLLIPLWFGVGVRKVKQSAARGNARSFVLLVAVTTALFFVAALI
jgi:hypothetical protein